MSFTGNIKQILNKLENSDKDRIKYTEDAVAIWKYVVEQLKAHGDYFRNHFSGFSLFESESPNEFNLYLSLKFSNIISKKSDWNGFVLLHVPFNFRGTDIGAPILTPDGYVCLESLQNWLRGIFQKVFKSTQTVPTPRGVYTLKYTFKGYDCDPTIEAVSGNREIIINLLPAIKFPSKDFPFDIPSGFQNVARQYPWFAIPLRKSGLNRIFFAWVVLWEWEMVKNSYNFKNVLRLMKGLRDRNSHCLPQLSNRMLTTVMLHKHDSVDWQRDEGSLLLEMWRSLVEHLRLGQLESFPYKKRNLFVRMSREELNACLFKALAISRQLNWSYQTSMHALSQLFP